MTYRNRNHVELCGVAETAPVLSHENHGEAFYRFTLEVPRLSGQADRLPIVIPAAACEQVRPRAPLRVTGQLRSFNNKSGQGNRLVITVLAHSVEPEEDGACNRIELSGVLCKPPVLRRTPLGRSICDVMLAVGRRYGRADYLPVIAWGQLAMVVGNMQVGERLCLEGRVQSRTYVKVLEGGTEERTAYEVSMMHLLEEEGDVR